MPDDKKVFVCKYIRTPGQPEVLQSGGNPISVSINAIPDPEGDGVHIGDQFSDAQQRSIVIAFDTGQPEPDPSVCPPPGGGTTTTSTSTTGVPTSTTTSSTTVPPTTTSTVPVTSTSTSMTTVAPTTSTSTTTTQPPGPTTTTTEVPTSTSTTTPPSTTTSTSVPGSTTTTSTSTTVAPTTTQGTPTTTTTTPSSTSSTTTSPSTSTTTPTTTSPSTTTTTTPTSSTSSTTSSTTTTTTSVPDETLDIAALAPQCINDVPFILLTSGNQPALNGMAATVRFFDLDGNLVQTDVVTYQANTDYTFLYPGASFDPVTGEATDWPGWIQLPDGRWTEDPTDSFLRDGLHVTVDVNPHAEADVAYPPATSVCASPPPPVPGPTTTVTGPTTTVPGTPPVPRTPTPPVLLPPTR